MPNKLLEIFSSSMKGNHFKQKLILSAIILIQRCERIKYQLGGKVNLPTNPKK